MGRFFTDLREFPIADYTTPRIAYQTGNVLNYIYQPWNIFYDTFSVSASGLSGNQINGDRGNGQNNPGLLAWNRPGILTDAVQEFFAVVRATGSMSEGPGIAICTSGGIGSENGYVLYPATDGSRGLVLEKLIAGSVTELDTDTGFTPATSTTYYIRLKKDATKVYGKIWIEGASEPGWMVEATDNSITSGEVAFYASRDNVVYGFHRIGIGTDGDAPYEDVAELTAMDTPVLSAEVSGDWAGLTPDVFDPVDGIDLTGIRYQVTLATDPGFSSPVVDDGVESEPSTIYVSKWVNLNPSTSYIARVWRETAYDDSGWSDAVAFTTVGEITTKYTDFSEYAPGEALTDWSMVSSTALAKLLDYSMYRPCDGEPTSYNPFRARATGGFLGSASLQNCGLGVSPSDPEFTQGQVDLAAILYFAYLWDSGGTFDDGEIVIRYMAENGMGLVFRDAYIVYVARAGSGDIVYLRKMANNVISSVTSYSIPSTKGFKWDYEFNLLRVQFIGTALKVRLWRSGDIEPTGWHIDTTDTSHSTGKIGVIQVGQDLNNGWDIISFTKGSTPDDPWPPPGKEAPSAPVVNTAVADAAGNVTVTLAAYVDTVTHLNTRYQVDLAAGDFSDPIVDTQYEIDHLTSIVLATLPINSYKVRAQFRNIYEVVGAWSSSLAFSVLARSEPVRVITDSLAGDPAFFEDMADTLISGIRTGGGFSSGPGGTGGQEGGWIWDETLRRYCEFSVLSGTDQQVTTWSEYGIDLNSYLNSDLPKLNSVYIIRDWVHFGPRDGVTVMNRAALWGVTIKGMRRTGSVVPEYESIGFYTKNGTPWRAYFSDYDGATGGVIVDVYTALPELTWNLFEIRLDGWNKEISWYANDELITSYSPTDAQMEGFTVGGVINAQMILGASNHYRVELRHRGHPTVMGRRIIEGITI